MPHPALTAFVRATAAAADIVCIAVLAVWGVVVLVTIGWLAALPSLMLAAALTAVRVWAHRRLRRRG